jgi:hypothetical protein
VIFLLIPLGLWLTVVEQFIYSENYLRQYINLRSSVHLSVYSAFYKALPDEIETWKSANFFNLFNNCPEIQISGVISNWREDFECFSILSSES